MQTTLAPRFVGTTQGEAAADILRDCVHCGFCTATCPTYQLLGDELDGPRGRIYLIKNVLEGAVPTASTQLHLDRCLTCRACETACPSGVRYGELLDIGRQVVDAQVRRPWRDRLRRAGLRSLTTSRLFDSALTLGRLVRPWLSAGMRAKIPTLPAVSARGTMPGMQSVVRATTRRMLLLQGCVQPAIAPQIQQATCAVFAALGIELIVAHEARCCGAIRQHLGDPTGALNDARRNIDAWWPHIEMGIEAIIVDASGCGVTVTGYGQLLRDDANYSAKAARVHALCRDPVQVLGASMAKLSAAIEHDASTRIAFHPPCTLQHGLKLPQAVESLLGQLGFELVPLSDAAMCCGSAGTYSIMQPQLSFQLRARRLEVLLQNRPKIILSANVGCITHLAAESPLPVQHWLEFIAERLVPNLEELH